MAGKQQRDLNQIPRSSGVYQILCKKNWKIYVGSTVDLRARWDNHRRRLRKGVHANFYLQQAWDKYGEANFNFSILEFVVTSELLQAEQAWIDKTRCAVRSIGFNICTIAGSTSDVNAQVWEGFVDPEGKDVIISNLYAFCRQHGLDFPSMHRLAKGKSKLKSYKGWTHRNSPRRREYVKTYEGFITPDGHPAGLITNLAAFCRKRGLDNTHMVALVHGRICSHHGWTHSNGKRKLELKTYTGFINPMGQRMSH
jgi:hypothetical protein